MNRSKYPMLAVAQRYDFDLCVVLSVQQKLIITVSVKRSCWKISVRSAAAANDCNADQCILTGEGVPAIKNMIAQLGRSLHSHRLCGCRNL